MADKKYPKDVEEIYYSTKLELEQKLSEAEVFVEATNAKSLEVVLKAITETSSLVGDFVKQKSGAMDKSWRASQAGTARLRGIIQEIASLQSKLSALDRAKEMNAFKKQATDELNRELNKLKENY